MTLAIPAAQGAPIAQWRVVDWISRCLTSGPAAGGLATVEFPQLDPDEMWLLDHAMIQCTSTTRTTLRLYEGDPSPVTLLSGSLNGNLDEADWTNGLRIGPSRHLTAQWSGATDGAVAVLNLQARQFRRG